jgi:hypothetical protein
LKRGKSILLRKHKPEIPKANYSLDRACSLWLSTKHEIGTPTEDLSEEYSRMEGVWCVCFIDANPDSQPATASLFWRVLVGFVLFFDPCYHLLKSTYPYEKRVDEVDDELILHPQIFVDCPHRLFCLRTIISQR